MAAEIIAFSDLFGTEFTTSKELGLLCTEAPLPIRFFTYSKSLFDFISKGSNTSDKGLMLDISCAREGFHNQEIYDIGFFMITDNIVDELT